MSDPHLQPYLDVVARVSDLAATASPDALKTPVDACPGWTAGDVVRHLAGLAEDWVDGNLDNYGSDPWAGAQVDRFKATPITEVLASWRVAANRFAAIDTSPLGGTPGMWAFGDGVVHEADLRPILAPGTTVPSDALALGLKAAIARWRGELSAAGVPPLDVIATDQRTWRIGNPDADAGADVVAGTVTTTGNELFRALFGRRSRSQVEAWEWSVDPSVYLDVPLPSPFRWAERPVVE